MLTMTTLGRIGVLSVVGLLGPPCHLGIIRIEKTPVDLITGVPLARLFAFRRKFLIGHKPMCDDLIYKVSDPTHFVSVAPARLIGNEK